MARLSRALLVASGLLASAGTATAAAANTTAGNATLEDGLHSLMVKAGKLYFGTATDVHNFADVQYEAIVSNKNNFGMITAENSMKWLATEANQGTYSYANADEIVAKAKANGQQMRCHTLVWYNQLPSFGTSLFLFEYRPKTKAPPLSQDKLLDQ
jgi:endo-1,4-beta-xylanase